MPTAENTMSEDEFVSFFLESLRMMGEANRPGDEPGENKAKLGLFVGQRLAPLVGPFDTRGSVLNSIYQHGSKWTYWHPSNDRTHTGPFRTRYYEFDRRWSFDGDLRKKAINAALDAGFIRIRPIGEVQASNAPESGLAS